MPTSLSPIPWLRRFAATAFVGVVALGVSPAATLPFDAPLHIQSDNDSPTVGTLAAGTSITPLLREDLAAAGLSQPPSGWIALRSSGPFTGFVRNVDVGEDGTINTGAEVREQPLSDAPKLLVVEDGDTATAHEPVGDWSRATIHTDLFVYVNALPPASRSQVADVEPTPAVVSDTIDTPPPRSPRRSAKPVKPKKTREPKVEPVAVETEGAPRTFVGYLMRTRRFLGRGPKYDYQLVDENNQRIALLELSALLATSPIEFFENRRVSVYGPGLTRPDVRDVIIRVQTLRLEK